MSQSNLIFPGKQLRIVTIEGAARGGRIGWIKKADITMLCFLQCECKI
jgi:hypothetical protein